MESSHGNPATLPRPAPANIHQTPSAFRLKGNSLRSDCAFSPASPPLKVSNSNLTGSSPIKYDVKTDSFSLFLLGKPAVIFFRTGQPSFISFTVRHERCL